MPAPRPLRVLESLPRDAERYRDPVTWSEWWRTIGVELTVEARGEFTAQRESCRLGPMGLVAASTSRHAAEADPLPDVQSAHLLVLQLSGRMVLAQRGREAGLTPGDCVLLSSEDPFRAEVARRASFAVLVVPQDAVDLPPMAVRMVAGRLLPADGLAVRFLGPHLERLAESMSDLHGPTAARLGHSTIDLFTTLLNDQLDGLAAHGEIPGGLLLAQMHDDIETRLRDPELTPSAVAERHFVSVRTMDEMFRAVGQSPSAWIRSRRLAHCRADLRDPQYRDMGVAEIARRWGFPTPAHFSRAYRAAFGVSPSADRRGDDDA
ncbi:AraC family transcriptional regulator [Streptomyces sp.]|uniref:AraC family transcriptional regulator n=1 Tax=Actinomycetes TaxID=1760 RepID=UPI002811FBC7|nr:AraC family transcriptional regulator [Streptomyces sp.]